MKQLRVNRIGIVGRPGCGKTTLAARIAERYQLRHVHLDLLFWHPNWVGTPTPEFRIKVKEALATDCWVADNYFIEIRDIVWGAAETIVWLDYPFHLTTRWFLGRVVRDFREQNEVWNGNRYHWGALFKGDPPLLWWMIHTYRTRPRDYQKIFAQPKYEHIDFIRLRTVEETDDWFNQLG